MVSYNHQEIEKKWQRRWEEARLFEAKDDPSLKKFYCLIEFPYPSGAGLHIGHPRSYTALDVVARKRRMEGLNVLYPIGSDAFGLPTENYAIKTKRPPQEVTKENIATFKRQLQSLGLSFDWSREVNTTDPTYYKWTQWMFLEFFKAGLAYKAKIPINWCTSCKIGLANEEIIAGVCERCGGKVEKRQKEQWMIAITKYADRLLSDLDTVDYLPKIKKQQQDWIGKSEGAEIRFVIASEAKQSSDEEIASVAGLPRNDIEVFTTRPDTIFGATFLVVSPEVVAKWIEDGWNASEAVAAYVKKSLARTEIDRTADGYKKDGVSTGVVAINPVNNESIPVWVADYVLGSYGTGAIMAVPQHDERDREFAETFGLPIVDRPLVSFDEAIKKTHCKRTTRYKLRDWVFSRQRYWGEPIPLVWCENCPSVIESEAKQSSQSEIVSSSLDELGTPRNGNGRWVPVPEGQLPVVLPDVERYEPTDTGESPLAAMTDWVNTTCPTCGGPARRETDTMPNWAGSSWYFLAYAMHRELSVQPSSHLPSTIYDLLRYWLPVDLYNGGMEHTTLHLLYSRFWNKFLFDRGHVPTSEPYARRHSHGLVLAADGTKMSKSKGNVVNPDEIVSEYGADALRLYILFMGPFEEPVPWNVNGLVGVRRFLDKVVRYVSDWQEIESYEDLGTTIEPYIKKISEDIEAFKFNTAVAAFMSLWNEVGDRAMTRLQLKRVLILLCPFVPHVANECWEKIGERGFVEEQSWPSIDSVLLVRDTIELAVQVNGKVRGTIMIARNASEEVALEAAKSQENVVKYIVGAKIKKVVYVSGKILNIVVE